MKVKPVILAGGAGTRLWPLSRSLNPKQFIKIFENTSLLQRTLTRNHIFDSPILVIGEEHQSIAMEQLKEVDIEAELLVEPVSRNTTPSVIAATLVAKQQGYDTVIILPVDHYISSDLQYISTIYKALKVMDNANICTIGIKPDSANTEYGYIKIKDAITHDVFNVEKFVEKPDLQTALAYFSMDKLGLSSYFWNSGIFIFQVDFLLQAAQEYQPLIFEQVVESLTHSNKHNKCIKLNKEKYKNITGISLDYAIRACLRSINIIY